MAERAYFLKIAAALDAKKDGPDWLWRMEPARIVEEKLTEMNGPFFKLHAYSVLPNAAHFLIDFSAQIPDYQGLAHPKFSGLLDSLRVFKGSTGRMLGPLLGRPEQLFWAMPHAERAIEQPEHFFAAIDFVLQSPVRADLCIDWREHSYSWVEPIYLF